MDAREQIRQRLDIKEVIGDYVALKPAGANKFKGLSPFSKEKTPSFHVDVVKQLWYCFSTKQGGTMFDFVMKVENISFREALEKLAARAGVTLEPRSPSESANKKRDLFEVNAFAAQFFQSQLEDSPALAYLERRGVSAESIKTFGLGFAPDTFDGLLKFAKARGISEHELLEAGLLSENTERGSVYDRFRNRVMFPIKDYLGRVVAFGGRVLDDSKPKYLNSPETEVFKKGETLYGLDLARKHIQETGEVVVVEGYMDVLMMHQHGLAGAVASLGTALTQDHAHLLARQGARRLAMMFDNDAAGQRATLAGLDQEIGKLFLVRAVLAPGGKDAADILLSGGKTELEAALSGGLTEVEFRLNAALEKFNPNTLDGKRNILQMLLPRLRPRDVFDPVALELQRLVADRLMLEQRMLETYLNQNRPKQTAPRLDEVQMRGMTRTNSGDEVKLAKILIQNPALIAKLDGEAAFESPLVAEVIEVARTATSTEQILEHFRGRPEAGILLEGLFVPNRTTNYAFIPSQIAEEKVDVAANEIASRKREEKLRLELAELKAQIPKAPLEQQIALARQCSEVQKAIEAERRLRLRNS
ncbi:MAG: DNA primase [Deinococcales bacterium]